MKPAFKDDWVTVYNTDALAGLRNLPEKSVHCAVTSPAYWGLRSYLPSDHPDKAMELGAEPAPELFVERLVEVFRALRRVLRDDGTLWLNLGSGFASDIIESQEYVLRDDLSDQEQAYVYAELAEHFRTESEAVSEVREADAPAEQDVPGLLPRQARKPSELPREGV